MESLEALWASPCRCQWTRWPAHFHCRLRQRTDQNWMVLVAWNPLLMLAKNLASFPTERLKRVGLNMIHSLSSKLIKPNLVGHVSTVQLFSVHCVSPEWGGGLTDENTNSCRRLTFKLRTDLSLTCVSGCSLLHRIDCQVQSFAKVSYIWCSFKILEISSTGPLLKRDCFT